MPTYQEFAQKIREKHNAYQDVDDRVLAEKYIEKYPVYAKSITFDDSPPMVLPEPQFQDVPQDHTAIIEKPIAEQSLENPFEQTLPNIPTERELLREKGVEVADGLPVANPEAVARQDYYDREPTTMEQISTVAKQSNFPGQLLGELYRKYADVEESDRFVRAGQTYETELKSLKEEQETKKLIEQENLLKAKQIAETGTIQEAAPQDVTYQDIKPPEDVEPELPKEKSFNESIKSDINKQSSTRVDEIPIKPIKQLEWRQGKSPVSEKVKGVLNTLIPIILDEVGVESVAMVGATTTIKTALKSPKIANIVTKLSNGYEKMDDARKVIAKKRIAEVLGVGAGITLAEGVRKNEIPGAEEVATGLVSGGLTKGLHKLSDKMPEVKAGISKLLDKTSDVPNPVKSIHRKMVTQTQLKDFETSEAVYRINQQTTKQERELMPFLIEGKKPPKELGRNDLRDLSSNKEVVKKLHKTKEIVKKQFDKSWNEMVEVFPEMDERDIANYVTHLWDIPKDRKKEIINWFMTKSPYQKKRLIDTYEEGIKKGLKPKTLDIGEILTIHNKSFNKATENKRFLDALQKMSDKDGVQFLVSSNKAPPSYISMDHPLLNKNMLIPSKVIGEPDKLIKLPLKFHPDLKPVMESVFGKRLELPGKMGDVLNAYEYVNAVAKKANLSFSLFHAGALTETGVALLGPKKAAEVAGNMKSLYRALKHGRLDIYEKKFEQAKDGIKHGLKIGASSDVQKDKITKLLKMAEESLPDDSMRKMGIKGLTKVNELWDKGLWDWLHNNLKVYSYEHIVSEKIKHNLLNKKMFSQKELTLFKEKTAEFVNDTYGGQNWELMMRSPKSQQIAQLALLSPDWLESTMKQAVSPLGIGSLGKGKEFRKEMGKKFWSRAMFYSVLGSNMANYTTTKFDDANEKGVDFVEGKGHFMWDNDPGHNFHVFRGRGTPEHEGRQGVRMYVQPFKQYKELPEMIADPIKKIGGKASPLAQFISGVFTGKTLGDFGVKETQDKEGVDRLVGAVRLAFKVPLPFISQSMRNEYKDFSATDLIWPSSKGMTRYKARQLYERAIINDDDKKIEEITKSAIDNGFNPIKTYESAVRSITLKATYEEMEEQRKGKLARTKGERVVKSKLDVQNAIDDEMLKRSEKVIEYINALSKVYKAKKTALDKE